MAATGADSSGSPPAAESYQPHAEVRVNLRGPMSADAPTSASISGEQQVATAPRPRLAGDDVRGPVRLRFAPSPTGYLHVGGARTAIYNDLLRQSVGGAYVLRIEDTDRARSDEAMTRQIEEALRWTGVAWDEGPFLQSERMPRHAEAAQRLLAEGKAYYCFCTSEQLDPLRREAEREGRTFRYPRTCASCSTADVEARRAAGEPAAVRFRMPDAPVGWQDLVRGDVEFPAEALDDFVLLRSDGTPTYHLSVVVDDVDMGIDLVLRGEDHVSNTPKHIRLFEALGAKLPRFGHLPLILGPDKRRLSKRTGATSVEEFRAQGILPEAFYNFLALLGWSPGDGRELMTRDELRRRLLARPRQQRRRRLRPREAAVDERAIPVEAARGGAHRAREAVRRGGRPRRARRLAAVRRGRRPAADSRPHARRARRAAAAILHRRAHLRRSGEPQVLADTRARRAARRARATRWAALGEWKKDRLEETLRALAAERGVKAAALIHPIRMALSASTAGPPLFDLVEAIGAGETASRLDRYRGWLRELR